MILAVDLGSVTAGWALWCPDRQDVVACGAWHVKGGRREHPGQRWRAFLRRLDQTLRFAPSGVELVAYELVRRHEGTVAAQRYGGAQALLEAWAAQHRLPITTVEVAEVKTAATGKGNAPKGQVLQAAQRRWPDLDIKSADAADAAWIAVVAAKKEGMEA